MFQLRRSASLSRRGHIRLLVLVMLAGLTASCDEPVQRAASPDSVRGLVTAVSDENPQSADSEEAGGFIEQPVLEQVLPPAERVYFAHGGDVWRAPVDGEPAPVTENEPVTDFSASATGGRVAILRIQREVDDDVERSMPSVHLPDGEPLLDLTEYTADIGIEQLSPIESLELTPRGDALAMTHQNGAVSLMDLAGNVEQLVEPGEARPGQLAWSSDGRFLTYLDPWLPNEPSALYLLMPERGVRQILVQPNQDGYGVVQAVWIPGTSQIVYIKESGATIDHGGDVFVVDATTGEQRLLFSSSQIAPVAGAVDLAVSPDGERVAVTGFAPGEHFPTFAGVWLFALPSGQYEELPIDGGETVTDLWWLGDTLLLRSIDEPRTDLPGTYTGQEAFTLFAYDPRSGELEQRYATEEEADSPDDERVEPRQDDSGIINR